MQRFVRIFLEVCAHKNYFYPNLPKNYQINQYEIPIIQNNIIEFYLDNKKKSVRLVRAHLEKNTDKSLHKNFVDQSNIDLNRTGTPLLEIITEPDIRSSNKTITYTKKLHKIIT